MNNKTIFSIGRDQSCDIVVYDPTNVVSREHATLQFRSGKYYLTDHSTNGTYKNGIRLSSGIEYPVSKKDSIVLGGSVNLDWSQVPKVGKSPLILIIIICLLVLSALLAGIYFLLPVIDKPAATSEPIPAQIQQDTVKVETPEQPLVRLENVNKAKSKKSTSKVGKKAVTNFKDEDESQTETQKQTETSLDPF